MTKSVEEQLSEAQAALSAVERNGQRNSVADRDMWRADHGSLATRVEKLERKAKREARGGIRTTRIVPL